jgi:hypothetical protein
MSQTPDLTDEQRANLATLAAYLRTLPAEYPDFSMDDFTATGGSMAKQPECGTAACAAGHGINAGIPALGGESWFDYSVRAFVEDDYDGNGSSPWDWCFSGSWSHTDNTAHGAADRITYMLAHGLPADADEQRLGEAPLSYRVVSL